MPSGSSADRPAHRAAGTVRAPGHVRRSGGRRGHLGGRDQSLSTFLPHPGQAEPVVPVDNEGNRFTPWRALPAEVRAVLRSYTVRARRRTAPQGVRRCAVDIDSALHEDRGPACRRSAAAASPAMSSTLGPAGGDNTAVRLRRQHAAPVRRPSGAREQRTEPARQTEPLRRDQTRPATEGVFRRPAPRPGHLAPGRRTGPLTPPATAPGASGSSRSRAR
ncbi:siderophore-interacting protein [Streptomyces sp. NPDC002809]|uniref:siderophore-interacting protein n=1 Tax=Streptomyces sp. NPDC002809 TaxID=3154433 RepID=UPI003332FC35